MKKGTTGRASCTVRAAPETLYALVSDVRRMGEWSPECRGCDWIGGASGPAVGAQFKGKNRRALVRWSTMLRVVTADEGQEFAFVTIQRGHDETKWTYRFEPHPEGSTVIESFEMMTDLPWYLRLAEIVLMGVTDRKADLESGMRETLARLRADVESGQERHQTVATR